MMIIGCDFHPRYQQIAMMDTETGELVERRLEHENGEARDFYAGLPKPVRVGMEATGYTQWFERLLAEFGHELWWGMRLPFVLRWCVSRRTTGGMPRTFSTCWWKTGFHACGCRRRPSRTCGSWCCIE